MDRSKRTWRWFVVPVSLLLAAAFMDCSDSKHLMLAEVPQVFDAGQTFIAVNAAPLISPDGRSVLYLKFIGGGPPFPLISRDLATGAERTLFSMPPNSILWTYNYSTRNLLVSVANGAGAGRQIAEYTMAGSSVIDYAVPSGSQDFNAAVSPDGQQLAFVRTEDGGASYLRRRSAILPSDTGVVVTKFSLGETVLALRWLDNDCVLVSSLINSGTTVENQVRCISPNSFNQDGLGSYAVPDPGGGTIASIVGSTAGPNDVGLSRLDGSGMTRLTASQSKKERVNWSLDGRALVYVAIAGQPVRAHLEVVTLPPRD